MPHDTAIIPLLLFPVFFAGMWLLVSFILSLASGWFGLVRQYPDKPEPASRTLHMQSGSMGANVRMNGVLRLAICPSGLRVGLLFLFAAFSRDFLVPWSDIRITRTAGWFKRARLDFGAPAVGSLTIPARTADQLAQAAGRSWPEAQSPAVRREPTVS